MDYRIPDLTFVAAARAHILRADGVVVHVREEELADRRAKGLDRWDEMWEGRDVIWPNDLSARGYEIR